jgi:hypothetical protein
VVLVVCRGADADDLPMVVDAPGIAVQPAEGPEVDTASFAPPEERVLFMASDVGGTDDIADSVDAAGFAPESYSIAYSQSAMRRARDRRRPSSCPLVQNNATSRSALLTASPMGVILVIWYGLEPTTGPRHLALRRGVVLTARTPASWRYDLAVALAAAT